MFTQCLHKLITNDVYPYDDESQRVAFSTGNRSKDLVVLGGTMREDKSCIFFRLTDAIHAYLYSVHLMDVVFSNVTKLYINSDLASTGNKVLALIWRI